jgi:hypothetical protein
MTLEYEWKNAKTGEIVEHDSATEPPRKPGKWVRVYSFGLGRIEGGASPSRPPVRRRGGG